MSELYTVSQIAKLAKRKPARIYQIIEELRISVVPIAGMPRYFHVKESDVKLILAHIIAARLGRPSKTILRNSK